MNVFYKDLVLDAAESVYEPREDSFLLADNLKVRPGETVLEIGTGCGLLAILAAKQGAKVTAVDINLKAIECSKTNAGKYDLKIDFRHGNLFEPVQNEKFDLIIFNPPYLPGKIENEQDVALINTGIMEQFLQEYKNHLEPGGRALLISSSLSKIEVNGKIIAEKKMAFEKLVLIELE